MSNDQTSLQQLANPKDPLSDVIQLTEEDIQSYQEALDDMKEMGKEADKLEKKNRHKSKKSERKKEKSKKSERKKESYGPTDEEMRTAAQRFMDMIKEGEKRKLVVEH